jgi:glycosyltransferase involved in cell wall biosynthesis
MTRLALVMIVRDEARCIARCLRSAKPFVDEMIVLDTGSGDDTAAIAAQLGARVYHFGWTGDFSAARNAALDYSSAEWNLVLDADEWIDAAAGAGSLQAALNGSEPFIGLLPVASEFDLQGRVEVAVSWIPRMLPRQVRYQGTIHEQPVSKLPRCRIQLPIMHDGYRQHGLAQKKGRNEALLLRALEQTPADPYLLYQLGKNYEVYEDYDNAVVRYQAALQCSGPEDTFRHDLVVRAIFALKKAQQHDAAIALSETEMPNWQHSPDFFFVLGDLLLDFATLNPATAYEELMPMIESSWLKCLEIGDQPALEGSVTGRGGHLAAHNLAVLYGGMGDPEKAIYYEQLAAKR